MPLASKAITSPRLFRRLDNQKSKLTTTEGRTTIYTRANSENGVLRKVKEVKSSFNPETRFSGCLYRSGNGHDFSYFRTLPSLERLHLSYTNIRKDQSQNIPKVIWNNEFLHRSSALSKIAHEAHSNAFPVLLESNGEEYLLRNTSKVWWKIKNNFFKELPLKEKPISQTLVTDASMTGLGSHLGQMQVGCLVKGSSLAAYKLLRNDGSFSCNSTLSKDTEGQKGVDQDGQQGGCILHPYAFWFGTCTSGLSTTTLP